MAITEEELDELIKTPKADIEKITKISSDGKTLITRIPKKIEENLGIEKGDRFRWLVDKEKINLDIIKEDGNNKKKKHT